MNQHDLIAYAKQAMQKAYAPYSSFWVGAALLAKDGSVYSGCNIENGAYPATCCAERTAFFEAVKDGVRDFSAIAVVGGKNGEIVDFCPPCGVCRQVMAEFCDGDFEIYLTDGTAIQTLTLGEILPYSFRLTDKG